MNWGKKQTYQSTETGSRSGQHKATMKVLDLPFIPTDICNVQVQTILVLIHTLVKLLETHQSSIQLYYANKEQV